eukprot:3500168-Pyramimonas_sp.AAC.1
MRRSISISALVIVLIKKRSSCVRKKTDPDFPGEPCRTPAGEPTRRSFSFFLLGSLFLFVTGLYTPSRPPPDPPARTTALPLEGYVPVTSPIY